MPTAESTRDPHLTPAQVAAYLDRLLGAREREQVESHLSGCPSCRGEVVEVARVRRPGPRRRWYVAAAAAAAIAVLGIALGRSGPNEPANTVTRGRPSEGIAQFAIVSPAYGATVPAVAAEFVWRSVATEATYRLTVTDASGGPVWTGATGDTALAVPDSVQLQPGETYFWYIDALLPDGRSASTGVKEFRTAP